MGTFLGLGVIAAFYAVWMLPKYASGANNLLILGLGIGSALFGLLILAVSRR